MNHHINDLKEGAKRLTPSSALRMHHHTIRSLEDAQIKARLDSLQFLWVLIQTGTHASVEAPTWVANSRQWPVSAAVRDMHGCSPLPDGDGMQHHDTTRGGNGAWHLRTLMICGAEPFWM